jgi:uncharacterized membrane protein YeaQ/YmgE (transglycosylase-associated protein family)
MAIISWVLWGLFVGVIARFLRPGKTSMGIGMTIVLGVAGSLIGGFIARSLLHIADGDNFDIGSFFIAVAASFLLLAIWEPIARRREKRDAPPPSTV